MLFKSNVQKKNKASDSGLWLVNECEEFYMILLASDYCFPVLGPGGVCDTHYLPELSGVDPKIPVPKKVLVQVHVPMIFH